jgi:hypothetical protein
MKKWELVSELSTDIYVSSGERSAKSAVYPSCIRRGTSESFVESYQTQVSDVPLFERAGRGVMHNCCFMIEMHYALVGHKLRT